jgi:hypothetical protein
MSSGRLPAYTCTPGRTKSDFKGASFLSRAISGLHFPDASFSTTSAATSHSDSALTVRTGNRLQSRFQSGQPRMESEVR